MNNRKSLFFWSIFLGSLLGWTGCNPTNSNQEAKNLLPEPNHFPKPVYNYEKNPVTKEGIALGRLLFFDPILSKDSTISCGSCHSPTQAYADAGKKFSVGIHRQKTSRNAPGLFNLRWHRAFFADGGIKHFELIPLAPLVNRQEMEGDLVELLQRLRNNRKYQKQFATAFQTDSIQSKHVLYALAQFMGTLVSANTKYDQYIQKQVNFNTLEQAGLQAFTNKCSSCHSLQNQLLTDLSYRNIGLDSVVIDSGRYRITEQPSDVGLFKVPSLRNVMLTPPYMHDGRFASIEEVLQHYDQGVKQNTNLDKTLQKNGRLGIPLKAKEKRALVSFLQTLTDSVFVKKHRNSKQKLSGE